MCTDVHETRQKLLREWMGRHAVDAALILKPQNAHYLSGVPLVCSALMIFNDKSPILITIILDLPVAREASAIKDCRGYDFPKETLMGKINEALGENFKRSSSIKIGCEKDTMTLRQMDALISVWPGAEFIDMTRAIDELRAIKSDGEIALIRKAISIAEMGMESAQKSIRPGVSEIEVAAEAEYAMRRAGAEKISFGTFVASGPRTLLAHPYASTRTIEMDDPVVVDLGASYKGYSSDLCRTFFAGRPDSRQKELLLTVIEAQQRAVEVIREGVKSSEIYRTLRSVFDKAGFGPYLPDDFGYGVGLRHSEFVPIIEKKSEDVIRAGMVFSLFSTTAYVEGVGGIRVEDVFLARKEGCEKLSHFPQPLY